ncbi:Flagellin FlgL [Pseudovibrio denitrificans]|uniref:Flagellin FlgL n=3 Tax=Pseudovibrio denitrificans TaxID=258256 RepID=A0A1I6ZM45_9HYPH|nr:Flagellin FlgL [Pseudovibrio denitrificans]
MNTIGYSKSHSYMVDLLMQQKTQLENKSIQLSSGLKSQTYGGISSDSRMALELRREISNIGIYEDSNAIASIQLDLMGKSLEHMEKMRAESVSAIDENNYTLTTDGQTTSQQATEIMLHETISQLNSEVNGYYLFGGKDATEPPVASLDAIMDGQGGKLGLKELMKRYENAHIGASENGRIESSVTSPAGVPTLTLQQDNVEGFGFEINSVTASSTDVTTAVVPEDVSDPLNLQGKQGTFAFNDTPVVGDTIEVELELPDGSISVIKLTATDDPDAGEGTFLIGTGANPTLESAQNAQAAFDKAISGIAKTELRAVADVQAGEEFFGNHGRTDPTPKVPKADGSGYETGTDLLVDWYTGTENDDDPRADKVVQIDDNVRVEYGARANEKAFSEQLQNLAVFVAADFTAETPDAAASEAEAKAYYAALASKSDDALSVAGDRNSGIQSVASEMSVVNTTVVRTVERQKQELLTYQNTLTGLENVDKTEVGTEIAVLSTDLEASYQATSMLLNLSMTNFLR